MGGGSEAVEVRSRLLEGEEEGEGFAVAVGGVGERVQSSRNAPRISPCVHLYVLVAASKTEEAGPAISPPPLPPTLLLPPCAHLYVLGQQAGKGLEDADPAIAGLHIFCHRHTYQRLIQLKSGQAAQASAQAVSAPQSAQTWAGSAGISAGQHASVQAVQASMQAVQASVQAVEALPQAGPVILPPHTPTRSHTSSSSCPS